MRYYWYFDAGQFTVIDEDGVHITPSHTVEVKYHKRAVNKITNVDEILPARSYMVEVGGTVIGLKSKLVVAVSQILLSGGSAISAGTLLYVDSDSAVNYILDEDFNTAGIQRYQPIGNLGLGVEPYVIDASATWDYQDDGYSDDVQLTALYYALSGLADMVPESRELVKPMYDRFKYRMRDLQIKLHSSKFSDITIKPNHF